MRITIGLILTSSGKMRLGSSVSKVSDGLNRVARAQDVATLMRNRHVKPTVSATALTHIAEEVLRVYIMMCKTSEQNVKIGEERAATSALR